MIFLCFFRGANFTMLLLDYAHTVGIAHEQTLDKVQYLLRIVACCYDSGMCRRTKDLIQNVWFKITLIYKDFSQLLLLSRLVNATFKTYYSSIKLLAYKNKLGIIYVSILVPSSKLYVLKISLTL